MHIICALVIGSICLHPIKGDMTIKIENPPNAMGGVRVVTPDWTAAIPAGGDILIVYDESQMAQACAEKECEPYHKHCVDKGTGKRCDYSFNDRLGVGRLITVEAKDSAALTAAEHAIAAITNRDFPYFGVDLSAMTQNSPDQMPPICGLVYRDGRKICGDPMTKPKAP